MVCTFLICRAAFNYIGYAGSTGRVADSHRPLSVDSKTRQGQIWATLAIACSNQLVRRESPIHTPRYSSSSPNSAAIAVLPVRLRLGSSGSP